MERSGLENLTISGIGSAAGGLYARVTVEGLGKVAGSMEADSAKFSGVNTVHGDVKAAKVDCEGKLKIEGKLSAGEASCNGILSVYGSVDGELLKLNGLLNVHGDCAVEQFLAEGAFAIDGLLNAGTIEILLHGRGKAREIGGETIKVRQTMRAKWKKMFDFMFEKWSPELHADTIEGDEIDLTNTVASVVRGNRVAVGPGCRIGRVEYSSELVVHPRAKVNEEVKIGG